MKSFIKDYFTFSRQEQRGIIFLLILLCCLVLALFFSHYYNANEKTDFSSFQGTIKAFEKEQNESATEKTKISDDDKHSSMEKNETSLFYFNPNTATENDWKKLGLKRKQIQTIINYLDKGGKFYSKKDLKKIYGLDKDLFEKLEPYILIEEKQNEITSFPAKEKQSPSPTFDEVIEINSADSAKLVSLKGIGPAFAKRIIKYRDLLGGFYKKEQLREVYGLDTLIYSSLEKQIVIDPLKVKKININECSLDELKKHPYFKYNLARSIVNFRQQHGHFINVSQIKQSDLVNDELYIKIVPYLALE